MNAMKLSIIMIGALTLAGPVWAEVGDGIVDGTIPAGTAVVDGDLSEWAGAIWNKADQPFTGDPLNFGPDWDPEWTARWEGSTIYVALRVIDDTPFYTDTYTGYPASDRIELYSYANGVIAAPGIYASNGDGYENAQQYFVGITESSLDSGGSGSWGTLGPTEFPTVFSEGRDLVNDGSDAITVATSATGAVGGPHTLVYEVAITQYDTFDSTDQANGTTNSVLKTLALGDEVGFAVVAGTRFGTYNPGNPDAGYAGTVSDGGKAGMSERFHNFGLYELTAADGDFDADTDVDGADFLKWQRGESGNPLSASDLATWEANFGATGVGPLSVLGASVDTVPEPSTSLLILAGLAFGSLLSRRGFKLRE